MIISYSQSGSFTQAISKTFDGKNPCKLCKVVQAGRTAEQEQEEQQLKPRLKLDLAILSKVTTIDFADACIRIPSPNIDAHSRSYQPPKPKPRSSLFSDSLA